MNIVSSSLYRLPAGRRACRAMKPAIAATVAVALAFCCVLGCATLRSGGVAALRVECNVPGAEVILNDVLVGQASELEHGKAVRPGTYRVEIRHPSYYSYFGEITLGNGGAAVVKAALHPLLD
ncbi:MAG: PEGA domain-containing protein [Polyangia bacterium]